MNLSLSVGDTFMIQSTWLTNPDYYHVDSVYTYLNRKHVRLNLKLTYANNEKLTWIEGVDSIAGITYQDAPTGKFSPYLLCYWRDGVLQYTNTYYGGQCSLSSTSLDEY